MGGLEALLNSDMIDFMLYVQELTFSELNHLESMILLNYNIVEHLSNIESYILEYRYSQYIKIIKYFKSKKGVDLSIFSSSGS